MVDTKRPNSLIKEKSPYLLQHAYNPVNWHAWGQEAFDIAKKNNRPIFLSIGYSTCHWCHVMEHESFEDLQIAEMINQNFIPIKVDREERPDIDGVYMNVAMAMTGRGGWPLTVVLTPDKKPFFAGTYFPPYPKWGSPGLMDILESIRHAWQSNQEGIIKSSLSLTELIQERYQHRSSGSLSEDVVHQAFEEFSGNYDPEHGGFGKSPKFPSPHNLSFLFRYWKRTENLPAQAMAERTLVKMAQGGMYDHLGGGFHRYSTDHQWQIPHFEKMLYDQAVIARAYIEAYQITKNKFYADVACGIFDYVLRDMQDQDGGFFSAEDADSLDPDEDISPEKSAHKKEGAFYVWRHGEVVEVLGKDDSNVFIYHCGIEPEGNAFSDPHGEFTGKNIIYTAHSLEKTAGHFGKPVLDVKNIIESSRIKLFEARKKRPRPHLDDKILVDWNGLMISVLAIGSRVFNKPQYLEGARRAAEFILKQLVDKKGRLLHRYREGESSIEGMLEDYVFFIQGLLDLYEATLETKYLERAHCFAKQMTESFLDVDKGGFYFTAGDAEELLFRQKESYDGAIPSGNSIAAGVLNWFWRATLDPQYEKILRKLFDCFASDIKKRPSSYAQMLIAFDAFLSPSQEIVIAGDHLSPEAVKVLEPLYKEFIPQKVILGHFQEDKHRKALYEIAPFISKQASLDNRVMIYFCQNHVCQLPISGSEQWESFLRKISVSA